MELIETTNRTLVTKLSKCLALSVEQRNSLKKYLANMNDKGEVKIHYEQKHDELGRFFAVGIGSFQSFSKIIRHTLIHDTHIDIDIVNCHPVILLQYCIRTNIKCKQLKHYVNNRDLIIKTLMEAYDTDRKTIKEMFISMMYLGKSRNYIRDNDLKSKPDADLTFLPIFEKEMDDISKSLANNHKILYQKMIDEPKEGKNPYSRTMSLLLGDIENNIIQSASEFLTQKGFVVESLCFDGLIVKKKSIPKNLFKELTKFVKKENNFEVQFEEKIMNENIDIDKENIEHAYTLKKDYMDIDKITSIKHSCYLPTFKVPEYEQPSKKQNLQISRIECRNTNMLLDSEVSNKMDYFEDYHAKIMNPSSILTIGNETFRMSSYRDFQSNYQNIKLNLNVKINSFTHHWLERTDIRTYQNIDFLPHPHICPSEVFNTFTGLEAIKKISNGENTDWFREHLCYLCGKDDEGTEYMMDYLAHMVQKPGELPRVACVFRSIEGVGKNTFFESFGNEVLGKQYVLQTAEPEDVIGRFNMNQNKLLVIMDEAQGKDTFAASEKIKNLITADTLKWESKGVNSVTLKNLARYIFFSNNDTPVKIGVTDRRFIMFECASDVANDHEYFSKLIHNFKTQGREIYDMLMNRDISNWKPVADRVQTSVYKDVQSANIPVMALFLEKMCFKNNESKDYGGDDVTYFRSNDFYNEFTTFLKETGHKFDVTNSKFARDLIKYEGIDKKRTKYGTEYNINYEKLHNFLVKNGYISPDM